MSGAFIGPAYKWAEHKLAAPSNGRSINEPRFQVGEAFLPRLQMGGALSNRAHNWADHQ